MDFKNKSILKYLFKFSTQIKVKAKIIIGVKTLENNPTSLLLSSPLNFALIPVIHTYFLGRGPAGEILTIGENGEKNIFL